MGDDDRRHTGGSDRLPHDREAASTPVRFERLDDEPGLAIHDRVNRRRYVLGTTAPTSTTPVPTDRFRYPVDAAVRVDVESIRLEQVVWATVRDGRGDEVVSVSPESSHDLPPASYEVELNAPVKLYLRVDGALSVSADLTGIRFAFDGECAVQVGARSFHDRPAATLTTSPDPESMMDVVSWFGSSLKTTTCERSYPTLRGHPPTVELGDAVEIPAGLDRPDTGVTLAIPPTHRAVFAVAPLAFYLGARVEPGETARLETESGFVHDLDTDRGFEGEVERIIKQAVLLDCVVRTEGYYDIDLHERAAIESTLDLDVAALYDEPLAAQLETYLSIPFRAVADQVPRWGLAAYVAPDPKRVEALPFLVDHLALVRPRTPTPVPRDDARLAGFGEAGGGDGSAATQVDERRPIDLLETDAMETAWFGPGVPVTGTKGSVEAYLNGLDREPTDGPISITVVCNDPEMTAEFDVVTDVYGSREELPLDVALYRDVETDDLRRRLAEEADFLHYIGHISESGFECPDGRLDAATLDAVGVEVFLLNACRSYDQGLHLVDAGSTGGVVTLGDVINDGAVAFGHAVARLLNLGFPLHGAIELARKRSAVGGQYVVVGDGFADVAQDDNVAPTLCRVTTSGSDASKLTMRTYFGNDAGMGTVAYPWLASNEEQFLAPGDLAPIEVSTAELRDHLAWSTAPVELDGELRWNDATDVDLPGSECD